MSRQESKVNELFARRLELWQKLIRVGDIARGSVVILRRPCTRKGCRKCASGERHPASYLGYRQGGKDRWLYLPKRLIPRAKEWVRNYRDLEKVLREVSLTNVAILRAWAWEMSQKNPARKGEQKKRTGRGKA